MTGKMFGGVPDEEIASPRFRLFRHFYLVAVAGIVLILVVAGLGLRFIFQDIVLNEAEREAVRISATLEHSEMRRFIRQGYDKNTFVSIADEELPELDRHMRICLAPFDIVQINIFDEHRQIVYSTDQANMGRREPDNAELNAALSGSNVSKSESEHSFWSIHYDTGKNLRVVKTYIPIHSPDEKIIGALEVDTNIGHSLTTADSILIRAAAVPITVLCVFAVLIFVIRREERAVNASTSKFVQTNEQLRQEITERKELEKELLGITERERRWIGQELHDSIGQQLTGIELMTKVLQQNLAGKDLPEADYAAKITALVNETTGQTRDLAKGLHPLDVGDCDLVAALDKLVTGTQHLFETSCRLKYESVPAIKDASVVANLYRIAQEAISNAIRHGKAEHILIRLASNGNQSTLTVESDGLDFPEGQNINKGMGLKIMSYRAEVIDGSFKIRRGHHGGTIVTCVFPHNDQQ